MLRSQKFVESKAIKVKLVISIAANKSVGPDGDHVMHTKHTPNNLQSENNLKKVYML
jgi:hypothetical protein